MEELKYFGNEASKTLFNALNRAVTASSDTLEMIGVQDQFQAAADSLQDYPVSTFLIAAHFITVIYKIRSSEGSSFASSNPFASVLSSVLLCFAGSIIQNFIFGLPPVQPFENNILVLLLIQIWYLMYFAPLDIFAKLIAFLPIRVALIVLKEVYRVKCIVIGLKLAHSLFPNAWFILIAGGSIRGCGSVVLKPFVHQIVGLGTPRIEFHRPTFATKISIFMSFIFTLQVKGMLNAKLASTSLIFTVIMATFQLLFYFTDQNDPLSPLEDAFARVFFSNLGENARTSRNERKEKTN